MPADAADRRRRAHGKGHRGEWLAALALMLKGYRILARRFRTKLGEVDLIAKRGDMIAIVEVKARPSLAEAMDAVTPAAQRRIEAAGDLWLARRTDLPGSRSATISSPSCRAAGRFMSRTSFRAEVEAAFGFTLRHIRLTLAASQQGRECVMCHHCVVESVKSRMLSRRDFFRGSAAAAGAVAIAATAAPRPLFAQGSPMRTIDLTHELHEGFPTFAGEQQFFVEPKFEIASDGYNLNIWTMEEHIGTHIDAPLHFSEDGNSVAEIAVEELVCPLAIIDIRERADADPDAQVTPDDIAAWVSEHGDIPQGACVALLSGWDRHADSDMFRNADEDGVMHFPGFHVEATDMLMEETGARVIAVDTLSLDHGPSADFAVHYSWLPGGRYGIECIANLAELPASGATLVVGAPKVRGGTGGPARVFAMV